MNSLLLEYAGDSIILNGDAKSEDEAVDIMASLGVNSTEAWQMIQRSKQEIVIVSL